MEILSKKIDTFKSSKHKGKSIDEYITYLMVDGTRIEAYVTLGLELTDMFVESIATENKITNITRQ